MRNYYRLASLLAACILAQSMCLDAAAQSFPSKPLRLYSGASTGSGADTLGRLIAAGMSQNLGQQVLVENRPSAGGNIVGETVAKAPPDGHSLLLVTAAYAGYVSLFKSLNYDLIRDFAPVTLMAAGPYVLVVHPSLPVKSVDDLIKLAKAKPGEIIYSSAGAGGPTFMAAELFKAQAGINLMHVPYKGGGPALTSVIAGETSVHFPPISTAMPNISSGRLRALGVTTARRIPLMPDLPTIADSGLRGYESSNWYGLMAPARTPREIISMLREAVVAVLNNPATNKRLNDLGFVAATNQPDEFSAYIKLEIERTGKIVRAFNLQPE